MERYCGRLSRAISSRKHPYASLNRRIRELQSLAMVRNLYGLRDRLPDYSQMHTSSFTPSFAHNLYPHVTLRYSRRALDLSTLDLKSVRKRMIVHLATQFRRTFSDMKDHVPYTAEQWGKIGIKGGDTICSSLGYKRKEENLRDATFIQYELLTRTGDAGSEALVPITLYGQLERIIVCDLPPAPILGLEAGATKILLDIHRCQVTNTRVDPNAIPEYSTMGRHEVIDATALRSIVGRIKDRGKWAIVRRFGGLDHADYVDIDTGAT